MFRGALILALGYVTGYSHAVARNDEVTKAVKDLRKAWADAATKSSEEPGETSEGDNASNTTEGEIAP